MLKKKISAAIAATAAATVCLNVSASEKTYTFDELRNLNNWLLADTEEGSGFDLDTDGRTDSFDMVQMRKKTNPKQGFTEAVFGATEENVKFIGRNYCKNGVTWLVQSGSAVEFTVTAKSAEVTVFGDSCINNGKDYAPRFAVLVDGEIILDDVMTQASRTIELFKGESSRTATVEIIHLSEANNGAIGVSEIRTNSDSAVPVVPTAEKELSIEFIGDSITCAYGVEGASQNEPFKTTTENFMKSYAYLTAKKLNADYSAVCYSGYGIISGYTSGAKNTDALLPQYYEVIGRPSDYNAPWDFSKKSYDVVVINLGTNDSSYIDTDAENRGPEYTEKYEDFLNLVREKNPDAYIICTFGTMGGDKVYPYLEKAVENYKSHTNDKRIMYYWSATHTQNDGFGSDWHPNEGTQQRSAYVLADKICKALGMESDQIGLDVAAEAVYSLVCNEKSGANAASYFSDYNKSFWMNTVIGGDSPDDIEAVISPIDIKKGGKYRLTFKCKAPDGIEVPIILRSGGKTCYSGKLLGNGNDKTFEDEFTSTLTDENSELVLQIGGIDYSNVTLSELRLEKIG